MENLIKKQYTTTRKAVQYYNNIPYISEEIIQVSYEYYYDGVKFLIGSTLVPLKNGKVRIMIEEETGGYAVVKDDFSKSVDVETLIALFHNKLKKSRKTIHEVIDFFKRRVGLIKNENIDLWMINFVTGLQ